MHSIRSECRDPRQLIVSRHNYIRSMSHHQIGWDEIVSRHALRLRVDRLLNQSHARQRRGIRKIHERRGLDDMLDIDIHGLGNPLRVGTHNHHLAWPQHHGIAESPVSRQTQTALQNQHLDVAIRDVLHHDRRASDGRRHRCRVDGRTPQSLRHLKQHRAFLQGHVARPRFETEERFGANPGQRVILKEQLGSGLLSSLQTQIVLYHIADGRRLFALRRIDHGDPIDDFGDFRRSQRTSVRFLEKTE
jgi:hypothetical protein